MCIWSPRGGGAGFSPGEMWRPRSALESAAGVLARFAPALAGSCLAHWPAGSWSRCQCRFAVAPTGPAVREDALGGLSATVRAALDQALKYPAPAGALADPSALTLHFDLTVEEALARLSESAGPVASRIFVLDRSQRLVGACQLLGSRRDTPASLWNWTRRQGCLPTPGEVPGRSLFGCGFAGKFLGAILKHLETRKSRPAMHLLASLSEFYSLGLSELFGGSSSGSPVTNQPGETHHANS